VAEIESHGHNEHQQRGHGDQKMAGNHADTVVRPVARSDNPMIRWPDLLTNAARIIVVRIMVRPQLIADGSDASPPPLRLVVDSCRRSGRRCHSLPGELNRDRRHHDIVQRRSEAKRREREISVLHFSDDGPRQRDWWEKLATAPHSREERFHCLAFDGSSACRPRAAALRNRVQADVDRGVRDVAAAAR